MIKNNKWKLIISSILIVFPTLFGIIVWDELPELITIHWGADGLADGWADPLTAVLVFPVILLVFHWVCMLVTAKTNLDNTQNSKAFNMIFWIIPLISIFANGLIYAAAFGMDFNASVIMFPLFGVLFIVSGNYMPKITQNKTFGLKLHWALKNEENWYATHRFGGKVFVIAGVISFFCAFLPLSAVPFALIGLILLIIIPTTLYSYLYYKKQLRDGRATKNDYKQSNRSKIASIIISIISVAILVCALILCSTGNVKIHYSDTDYFRVEATYNEDIVVKYSDIASVEYMEISDNAERVLGFSSFRLSVGWYKSEAFGNHSRYTYTNCDAYIVIKTKEATIVINRPNAAQTHGEYEEIISRWNQFKEANE